MCTKFQINRIILTLFSGVWDKNPPSPPVAEKVVKCRAIGLNYITADLFHIQYIPCWDQLCSPDLKYYEVQEASCQPTWPHDPTCLH